MDTNTITISALASIIGLGFLRMLMTAKGIKFSLRGHLLNITARIGHLTPTTSNDSITTTS